MASGIDLKMNVSGANKVQRELKQTGKAARGMGAGVSRAGAAMGGMAAAINPVTAGLAIAAAGFVAVAVAAKVTKDAFVGTIKSTIKLAGELDTITKKAQSIGATNTDIQLVSNAMALFGVETDQTIKATQKFNQALGLAMLPDAPKTLLKAFDRLGMSARELAEMPLRERFIKISAGFATYESQATRAADASLLFGRMGKDALTAFSQGGAAMSAAISDVEGYGLASDQAFKNAEELVDAQLRLELAFKGLKTDALEPLMPVLQGTAQGFADILAALDRDSIDAYGESFADLTEHMVVSLVSAGPIIELALKGIGLLSKVWLDKVSSDLLLIDKLTWWKGMLGVDELSGLDESTSRWKLWGDEIIAAISAAREEAQGPVFGPQLPDPDDMPTLGPDLPPGYVPPPPRRGRGAKTTRAAKVVDPLAGLKRELEALRQSLLTKEQILKEARDRELRITNDGIAAELLSVRDGEIQKNAIRAEYDQELRVMAKAQADAIEKIYADAAAKEAARKQVQRTQAIQIVESVGTFAGAISSIITSLSDEQNEEAKKAAKVFFGIQQATALGLAIVYMAESIAAANKLGFPANIPAMIAAGAAGGAQIATIAATTIQGLAHAGLPPGALAGSGSNEATIMMRRDEMILDPVGTKAISQMLSQRTQGGQPIQVNTTLEIDGDVLGRTVDTHLVRSSERGLSYQNSIRY